MFGACARYVRLVVALLCGGICAFDMCLIGVSDMWVDMCACYVCLLVVLGVCGDRRLW